jgi:predicted ATPase
MFDDLRIPKFGLVNLLVGRNNTGKSSILEAISLLATNASLPALAKILERREENLARDTGPTYPILSLVRRGRHASAGFELRDGDRFLTVKTGLFRWTAELGDVRRLELLKPGEDSYDSELRIEVTSLQGRRVVEPLWASLRTKYPGNEGGGSPCEFVATAGLSRGEQAELWSGIAATDWEDRINRQMHSCFPEIERVSMVSLGGETLAVAKVHGSERAVALRSLGNRFFGLAMAAASASNGVLLIDEVEIGIHYSIQVELWRFLAQAAFEFNVQIFATTHSEDAVRAFGVVSKERPEADAQLIRLQTREGMVEAVGFGESDLAYARETQMEIR